MTNILLLMIQSFSSADTERRSCNKRGLPLSSLVCLDSCLIIIHLSHDIKEEILPRWRSTISPDLQGSYSTAMIATANNIKMAIAPINRISLLHCTFSSSIPALHKAYTVALSHRPAPQLSSMPTHKHRHSSHNKHHTASHRKDDKREDKPKYIYETFWYCHWCNEQGPMSLNTPACPEVTCSHWRCELCPREEVKIRVAA
jgi:hypothetical protein